jgi:hypothetical protein
MLAADVAIDLALFTLITPLALVGVILMTWHFFSYHLYLFGGSLVFSGLVPASIGSSRNEETLNRNLCSGPI